MIEAKIVASANAEVDFLNLVSLVAGGIASGSLENQKATSFSVTGFSGADQLLLKVEGKSLKYVTSPAEVVSSGTIEKLTLSINGVVQGTITTKIDVKDDLFPVVLDSLSGDEAALAKFFLGIQYDYTGSNGAENAPEGLEIGENIGFNLKRDDSFDFKGGNDIFFSGDGKDKMNGGAGDDMLSGGKGNDEIHGEAGKDTLNGVANNDLVKGGAGDDKVNGGDGNDRVYGDADDDTLTGGKGDDKLHGGSGDDELRGDADDDTLSGNSGDDKLFGGSGKDRLKGGSGDDRLSGGSGTDTGVWDAAGDQFTFKKTSGGIDAIHSKGTKNEGTDSFGSAVEKLEFDGETVSYGDLLEAFGSKTTLSGADFFD